MFGLPGGGPNLDVVGAAQREGLRFVLAHGEAAAGIMASTHGLLTRTPTAVVATRGPGATSLANAVAQATLDRYPLVAITDTVPAEQRRRVAHQRIDQRALFAPVALQSITLGGDVSTTTLDRVLARTVAWPFGAVHLDYDAYAPSSAVDEATPTRPLDPTAVAAARHMIERATRPLVIAGMEAAAVGASITSALTTFGAPVLTTYQAIGLVPTEGPVHAGLFTNGALEHSLLADADLVVTVGLDLVEPIPAPWTSIAPVIRLSSEPQLDEYLPADIDLVGDLAELAAAVLDRPSPWLHTTPSTTREAARSSIRACEDDAVFGPVAVVDTLARSVADGTTVTVDAGAHFLAVMPLWPVDRPFDLLISNGLATMGFAVPAAIGAALARPGRPALALVGDGGLSMTVAELETIARLGLPITVVVFNDAALSLIEIKQGAAHGGPEAVRYEETDFAAIARASGLDGTVVRSAAELATACATGSGAPRLIDARIDPSSYPALISATRG